MPAVQLLFRLYPFAEIPQSSFCAIDKRFYFEAFTLRQVRLNHAVLDKIKSALRPGNAHRPDFLVSGAEGKTAEHQSAINCTDKKLKLFRHASPAKTKE